MSISPSSKLLFNSTSKWSVLMRWFLCMSILCTTIGPSTLVKLTNFKPSSCFFFVNLIRLSRDSSFLSIAKIVSIGDNEIFPLMKCVSFLNFIISFFPAPQVLPFNHLWLHFPLLQQVNASLVFWPRKKIMFCSTQMIQLFKNCRVIINQNLQLIVGNKWCFPIFSSFLTFVFRVPHTKIVSTFHPTILRLMW